MTEQPIIISSVFKSGTWLLRRIVSDITHYTALEPKILLGEPDYTDPEKIFCATGHFYSWHFVPVLPVQQKLQDMDSKVIFLLRNIYDLVVSMYYHFANNIDVDIGRGAQKHDYFASISVEEGINQIIHGSTTAPFKWQGISYHLRQMQLMLEFSTNYHTLPLSYEQLSGRKHDTVNKIAAHLNIGLNDNQIKKICQDSAFAKMKREAALQGRGSHFRKGLHHDKQSELTDQDIDAINRIIKEQTPSLPDLAHTFSLAHDLLFCAQKNNITAP